MLSMQIQEADVTSLAQGLHADPALVLLFVSSRLDLSAIAAQATKLWGDRVIGCTTAGEIGPHGYGQGGMSACSFAAGSIRAQTLVLDDLQRVDKEQLLAWQNAWLLRSRDPVREAAIMLVDGLSHREEYLTASIYPYLCGRPLVGGSAGDDFSFEQTQVLANGAFRPSRAVLTMVQGLTLCPKTYQLQDFAAISDDLVITDADPGRRIIREIDGEPALQLYARHLGMSVEDLSNDDYDLHSLMVQVGGAVYIRAVRSPLSNDALLMHSAVDEGMMVQIGRSGDSLASLCQALTVSGLLGSQCVGGLAFDCSHRYQQMKLQGGLQAAGALFASANIAGFTTYGELTDGLHVNQTCTGVLFQDAP